MQVIITEEERGFNMRKAFVSSAVRPISSLLHANIVSADPSKLLESKLIITFIALIAKYVTFNAKLNAHQI